MAAVTAKLVKELRDKTGAGMMDCKKALAATDGDTDKAVEWLRQKGIASAEKKSGRTAAQRFDQIFSQHWQCPFGAATQQPCRYHRRWRQELSCSPSFPRLSCRAVL